MQLFPILFAIACPVGIAWMSLQGNALQFNGFCFLLCTFLVAQAIGARPGQRMPRTILSAMAFVVTHMVPSAVAGYVNQRTIELPDTTVVLGELLDGHWFAGIHRPDVTTVLELPSRKPTQDEFLEALAEHQLVAPRMGVRCGHGAPLMPELEPLRLMIFPSPRVEREDTGRLALHRDEKWVAKSGLGLDAEREHFVLLDRRRGNTQTQRVAVETWRPGFDAQAIAIGHEVGEFFILGTDESGGGLQLVAVTMGENMHLTERPDDSLRVSALGPVLDALVDPEIPGICWVIHRSTKSIWGIPLDGGSPRMVLSGGASPTLQRARHLVLRYDHRYESAAAVDVCVQDVDAGFIPVASDDGLVIRFEDRDQDGWIEPVRSWANGR